MIVITILVLLETKRLVVFGIGYTVTKLLGLVLVWENCGYEGVADKYGPGFAAAGVLYAAGMGLALNITNVNWQTHYIPIASEGCVGFCVNLKFCFQLVLPLVTFLSCLLTLLSTFSY